MKFVYTKITYVSLEHLKGLDVFYNDTKYLSKRFVVILFIEREHLYFKFVTYEMLIKQKNDFMTVIMTFIYNAHCSYLDSND